MRWTPVILQGKVRSKLPHHEQEILVTVSYWDDNKHKQVIRVLSDTFYYKEYGDGYSQRKYRLKSGIPFDKVRAWMPLPSPYSCNETSTEYILRTRKDIEYDDIALSQTEPSIFERARKEWEDE